MRVTFEKITNGIKSGLARDRSTSDYALVIAKEIINGLKDKGDSIRSLTRMDQNRKGTVVFYIPESLRGKARKLFDLNREPLDFVIQCKSGKNNEGKEVVFVTVGFSDGSHIIDSVEDWLIESPVDGNESKQVVNSRKLKYCLDQLVDLVGDIRGRQK